MLTADLIDKRTTKTTKGKVLIYLVIFSFQTKIREIYTESRNI